MNANALKAQYGSEIEACLAPKFVDAKCAANIVHLLFANLDRRLAGYDPNKALRPWLFSCAIADAIGVRHAIPAVQLAEREASATIEALLGGLTYSEAAARLGVPLGTFKVCVHRVRRRLLAA